MSPLRFKKYKALHADAIAYDQRCGPAASISPLHDDTFLQAQA
jgi:hypothetical protein